ncbi:hypothetical protein HU200_060336 [Digitaria exilis]|uniref:Bifunctional inhibitor/plant lipid transfer protein/seed storage helical domain-containing protein n=1 Tax=Digitaria exilis TaxID=1010633 RepID=A0A835E2A4_9POAL|nr:hypothetical protein HU200_060335 [Digitaria exilis]KAF8657003.1 hypothetical protein HU200_060336 [Digitaria exilis]CAB3476525.1 unnamed protein product [Digitaria exilis]CAB3476526.1 unnamed protein product [Digitaria exilis]
MTSKLVPAFIALQIITTMTLFFPAAVHGCEPSCSNPSPPPPPAVPTPSGATCPIDTADLSVCVDFLDSLLHIGLNVAPSQQCCPLLQPLASADAALCVCGVIKALNLNVPVDINLLLNKCDMPPCPPGFTCPLY